MPNPQPGQEQRMDARFAAVDFAAHTSAFRERVKKALTLSRSDFLDKCCFDLGEPKTFKVVDAIGAHDPCYLVIPGGSMLPLNHFTCELTDVCRAIFIAEACNAALTRPAADPGEYGELEVSANADDFPSFVVGFLGARVDHTCDHPSEIVNARLDEIERRIIEIEAALSPNPTSP